MLGSLCLFFMIYLLTLRPEQWEHINETELSHVAQRLHFPDLVSGGFHAVTDMLPEKRPLSHHYPIEVIDLVVAVQHTPVHEHPNATTTKGQVEGVFPTLMLRWELFQEIDGNVQSLGVGDSIILEVESEQDELVSYDSQNFKNYKHDDHSLVYFLVTTNSTEPVAFMFEIKQLPAAARGRIAYASLIMIVVYGLILSEKIHRTLAAFIGSFLGVAAVSYIQGAPSLHEVVTWMDIGSLALLFGMMLMVHIFSTTGFFQFAAIRTLELSKGDLRVLMCLLSLVTAFLSAFLDNVTTILLIAPVTIEVCKVLEVNAMPYLVSEAIFSNLGGTTTMIGDPPNIIIGNSLSAYVGFADFLWGAAPPVVLSMIPCLALLLYLFRDQVHGVRTDVDYTELKKRYPITDQPLLLKCTCVLVTVIFSFFLEPFHHIEAAWIAIIGAIAMLFLASRHQIQEVLIHIEWDTLMFFAGLFVMVEAVRVLGLINAIADFLTSVTNNAAPESRLAVAMLLIIWVSAFASAVLDNIPFTATMVHVIVSLSEDTGLPIRPLIWSLAIGACLGGNGTLVGASANLVMASIAQHRGNLPISFMTFTKIGFPVMLCSVTVCTIYLMIVHVAAGVE
eukprot:TRINITY_DN434_c0_g1_i1.p1 TRINITY_DN434_c0_g1~~TRINITY_DN434_c0_g1_i1.p1  ORF type:complete len:618 (+),score=152.95 TRINITY_DN434_c0_g1_i1:606-2459(+)